MRLRYILPIRAHLLAVLKGRHCLFKSHPTPLLEWWGLGAQGSQMLIKQSYCRALLENYCNYDLVPAEGWVPILLITLPGASDSGPMGGSMVRLWLAAGPAKALLSGLCRQRQQRRWTPHPLLAVGFGCLLFYFFDFFFFFWPHGKVSRMFCNGHKALLSYNMTLPHARWGFSPLHSLSKRLETYKK